MIRHASSRTIGTLASVAPGVPQRVAGAVPTSPRIRRRLAELGVREGALVVIRNRTTGGGAILEVDDARIAVSRQLLATIRTTTPSPTDATSTSAAQPAATIPTDDPTHEALASDLTPPPESPAQPHTSQAQQ